jgi:Spy/CpxP family protein refolding chaperone
MNCSLIRVLLVSVLLILPLTAFAQMKEGGGEKKGMMEEGMMSGGGMAMDGMMGMMGMQGRGMGHDMMGMQGMMNMMQAMSQMDLTPEQKKNIQQIKIKHQKEAIPLFGKIQMSGVELQEILLGDPIDVAKAKEKIKEKHDAMMELEMSHLLLVQQLKSHLTPEQRERMESMMEMKPQMEMMGPPKEKKPSKKGSEKPADSPKTPDPHGH